MERGTVLVMAILFIPAAFAVQSAQLETSIEHPYSTILVSVDSTRTVEFTVENHVSREKELMINLTGVNSWFWVNHRQGVYHTIPANSRKTFQIAVSPLKTGRENLTVTTYNRELGTANVDRVRVTALETLPTTADLPGPGFIQLVLLSLLATVFYSRSI
ncbi:MAG: hypothetical protein ABEJ75_02520 [Candidatus Nanohaloarchaea archaeon]